MDESKTTELNRAITGIWDSLTDEQKAKAKACNSMDELASLAASAGVELPDEMLDAVAGSIYNTDPSRPNYCAYCKKKHVKDVRLKDMITPAGESNRLLVAVYTCTKVHRIFYYSSARNTYYDDTYHAITIPAKNGC